MAVRIGTLTTATMRIQDDTIPQPIVLSEEVKGGWSSKDTLLLMNSIPTYLREWGMACTVTNDTVNNGTYILTLNASSGDITDNNNWRLLQAGSSGTNVKKLDKSINGTGTINLPANCILFCILVNAQAVLPNFKVGYTAGVDDLVMQQSIQSGFQTFQKGTWIPSPLTIYFTGVDTQSTCSAIIFTF